MMSRAGWLDGEEFAKVRGLGGDCRLATGL